MTNTPLSEHLIAGLRAGDEALDRGQHGPADAIRLLDEAGLLTAPLPVEHGGRSWGTSPIGAMPMLDTLVALGSASLPVARLYEGHVNALALVAAFGTAVQRENVSERVRAGTLLAVWGADATVRVEIAEMYGEPVLSGKKAFASGVGDVGLAIVTAKAGDQTQMVLIDANDPERGDPGHWDVDAMVGSRSGLFDCTGLPAGDNEMLGLSNDLFTEPGFHGGLWRLAACYAGALGRIAQLLSDLLEKRGQRLSQPMIARLGHVAIEAESALLWATQACQKVERANPTTDDAVRTALFAREAVEMATERALALVERAAGTAMHARASELGRMSRDLRFYLRQADLDGKLALATQIWIGTGCATPSTVVLIKS